MSWFNDLFTSPREKEGKKLYKDSIGEYDNVLNEIGNLQSSVGDINSIGDVRSKFNLPSFDRKGYNSQVDATFNPSRGALATRFARMRKDAGNRMSESDAAPGMTFGAIDGGEASAFGDLESAAGNAKLQGFDKETEDNRYIAQLLQNIFGQKDSFGFNKINTKMSGLQGKQGAQSNYLGSLSDDSTFDDILGVANTAANVYGAFSNNANKAAKVAGAGG